jgi:hypothetical protein
MPKFTASLNLPKYSSAPSTPTDGDVYYNTSDHKVYSRINGAWVDLGATSAPGSGIPETIIDAKGDLIVGSAADTAIRLAVGTDGQIVSANSAVTGGIEWIDNVAEETRLLVKNETGSTLNKGQVIYINGASGNLPTVTLARANSEATSSKTVGVVRQTISNNESGYVTLSGLLKNVDTQGFTAGQAIWLSAATAGAFTGTRPSAPDHGVLIGYIPKVSANGEIFVMIQNGFELHELHNVSITSAASGDYLRYNGTVWTEDDQVVTLSGAQTLSSKTLDSPIITGSGIDIPDNTAYKINAVEVLNETTLGAAVVNSSLTSVGTIITGTWEGSVVAIEHGGTGQDTAAEAINALLPVQTTHSGKFLTTDGTNPSWYSIGDVTLDGGGA